MKQLPPQNPIEKLFHQLTRYQIYLFFVVCSSMVPVTWHTLSLIFLFPPMEYHCNVTSRLLHQNFCPCKYVLWNRTVFEQTIQTKFNIYCESEWLISLSECITYTGMLIGAFLFGYLSDKYGRLSMYSMSCLTLAVSGCIVSVMPTMPTFILARFFEGVGNGGTIVTAYVLCIEYSGRNHREMVTALYHVPINLGHLSLAGLSYLVRDCDDLLLIMSVPLFLYVATRWCLMESPKWLMDNDDIDGAAAVMEKFCSFNSSSCENIKDELRAFHREKTKNHKQTKMKFWNIFKHKKLCISLGCMCVIYFVCGAGYYGVSQFIGKMSGDIHLNVALSGLMLIPGTLAGIFLLKILRRRPFLMCSNFFAGLLIIIAVFIPDDLLWLRIVFASLANCFFFLSFLISFLYGCELFPTTIRNSVLGFLTVLSRAGQIVAPLINDLSQITAGLFFGIVAIVGAVLCWPLPETKDIELPSSLEETETLTRNQNLNQAALPNLGTS